VRRLGYRWAAAAAVCFAVAGRVLSPHVPVLTLAAALALALAQLPVELPERRRPTTRRARRSELARHLERRARRTGG
jgi:hypothetical protein